MPPTAPAPTAPPYAILTPISLRSAYVTLTDALIVRMEELLTHPDGRTLRVLYLDKSGRPVAWLVRALWPVLARVPGTAFSEHVVPPPPSAHFANIDREQWWDLTGASETGMVDVDRVPLAVVAGLRAAFAVRRTTREEVWATPTFLDGSRILVVDEVSNTGDTLRIAGGLVARAFPDAVVTTAHWMTPGVVVDSRSGQRRTATVPVWYRSDTTGGRLIGNRYAPSRGVGWRGAVGADFLSTVPVEPDLRGRLLRSEIERVSDDVARGRLLVRPAVAREDAVERIRELSGYQDPREFTLRRLEQAEGGQA